MPKGHLTEQQEQFCQFYVEMRHGTNAAIAAGYSKAAARQQAALLLTKTNINTRIFQIRSEQMADVEISAKRVLNEMAAIAFSSLHDVSDYNKGVMTLHDFSELSRQELAAVQSVKIIHSKEGTNIHFQLYDKQKALEMLGRYLALFNDKMTIDNEEPIKVQFVEAKDVGNNQPS